MDFYALLIGIDDYPGVPLSSCVKDAQELKRHIEQNVSRAHIQMLISGDECGAQAANASPDADSRPTYEAVIQALERITLLGKPGDCVLIHFSGHGTRSHVSPENGTEEFTNVHTGDVALVLLDTGAGDIRYLPGQILAFWRKAMTSKGMTVTLVLDCCFSAALYRRSYQPGDDVRFLAYDPKVDIECQLRPQALLAETEGTRSYRKASMLPSYLIDPDLCAALVACGPHEFATSIKTANGGKHGALTYFLLEALKERGGMRRKLSDIHRQVCAMFNASGKAQHPVLYGNKNQAFFGPSTAILSAELSALAVYRMSDGVLRLQAGQAHGVEVGDQYAIGPVAVDPLDRKLVARVCHVRALTSDLDGLNVAIEDNWVAQPLTQFSLSDLAIHISPDLPHRGRLIAELQKRSLGVTDIDEGKCSFRISQGDGGTYEVYDKSRRKIANAPTFGQDEEDLNHLSHVMGHLAKFTRVLELSHEPDPAFRDSFRVSIVPNRNKKSERFGPGSFIEIEYDVAAKYAMELVTENLGHECLYLFVYDLGSAWQIENTLRGSYEVVTPANHTERFTGKVTKRMKTVIPAGCQECEDVIKVIVTSQPANFDLLELPKLGQAAEVNRSSRKRYRGNSQGSGVEQWFVATFRIRTYTA
jgi:hypothetical protein